MQIIRFRRSKPAGRNRFVFLSVRRLSGKRENLPRQPERPDSAARQKAPSRRRTGRFHAVPNVSGTAFFRGQGGRAQGVFANPSIQFDECIVLPPAGPPAIIPRAKTLACKGVFVRPSMQCGGRMSAKAERPSVLLPAGPHCYYNTSGALCHHLKLFFCKNLCARPMGNFTKTTLHKIICMLQSNR